MDASLVVGALFRMRHVADVPAADAKQACSDEAMAGGAAGSALLSIGGEAGRCWAFAHAIGGKKAAKLVRGLLEKKRSWANGVALYETEVSASRSAPAPPSAARLLPRARLHRA